MNLSGFLDSSSEIVVNVHIIYMLICVILCNVFEMNISYLNFNKINLNQRYKSIEQKTYFENWKLVKNVKNSFQIRNNLHIRVGGEFCTAIVLRDRTRSSFLENLFVIHFVGNFFSKIILNIIGVYYFSKNHYCQTILYQVEFYPTISSFFHVKIFL